MTSPPHSLAGPISAWSIQLLLDSRSASALLKENEHSPRRGTLSSPQSQGHRTVETERKYHGQFYHCRKPIANQHIESSPITLSFCSEDTNRHRRRSFRARFIEPGTFISLSRRPGSEISAAIGEIDRVRSRAFIHDWTT